MEKGEAKIPAELVGDGVIQAGDMLSFEAGIMAEQEVR